MIRYQCPHCAASLKLHDSLVGKNLFCPACHNSLAVAEAPPPSAEELLPLDTADTPQEPDLAPIGLAAIAPNPKVSWLKRPARPGQNKQRQQAAELSWTARWGILLGAEALLLLVFLPIFILAAGSVFVTLTLAFLAVFYLLATFAWLRFMRRGFSPDKFGVNRLLMFLCMVVCGMILLGGGLTAHLMLAKGTVYIDNYSLHDVHLELNGQPWQNDVQRNTSSQATLRRGTYTLVVRSAATKKELDRRSIEVSWTGDYILNVLSAQAYYKGLAHYGAGQNPASPPDEWVIREAWFAVDVDHLFQAPPASINVQVSRNSKPGSNMASRTYLLRRSLRGVP